MNMNVVSTLEGLVFDRIQELEKEIIELDINGDYINLLNTTKDNKSCKELSKKFKELTQILYILTELYL